MTLHLRELLRELWAIALVRRLVWTPVVVLVSLTILVQLYGWYRYVTLLVEVNEQLIPAIEESSRDLKQLRDLGDGRADACDPEKAVGDVFAQFDSTEVEISALVDTRDLYLAQPDWCFQMAGLAVGVLVVDRVMNALDTGEYEPKQLLQFLALAEGTGWYPLIAELMEICGGMPTGITRWLAGGYEGALCVGLLKGIEATLTEPDADGMTVEIVRRECAGAFLGADRWCSRTSSDSHLVRMADCRRSYLKILQLVRQTIEAKGSSRSRSTGQLEALT